MEDWHVMTLLMDPPIYRVEKGGFNTPHEFGPSFKTMQEATDFIQSRCLL